jgi:hypothetical protein
MNKEKVTEALNNWLQKGEKGRMARDLTAITGVHESIISSIKNGKYEIAGKPIKADHYHKLAAAMGMQADNELHWDNLPDFVRMQKMCAFAQRHGRTFMADGYTRWGKSYALSHYARHNAKVVMVKLVTEMNEREFLTEVCRQMRIDVADAKRNKPMLDAITAEVQGEPGWLIICDEAEMVKRPGFFLVLKELIDYTDGHCGIVVCGMELEAKINYWAGPRPGQARQKGIHAPRVKQGFPQLRERLFTNILRLDGFTQEWVKSTVRSYGFTNTILLNHIARQCTGLQWLNQTLKNMIAHANGNAESYTIDDLNDLLNF